MSRSSLFRSWRSHRPFQIAGRFSATARGPSAASAAPRHAGNNATISSTVGQLHRHDISGVDTGLRQVLGADLHPL
jgi:hypothetical protein